MKKLNNLMHLFQGRTSLGIYLALFLSLIIIICSCHFYPINHHYLFGHLRSLLEITSASDNQISESKENKIYTQFINEKDKIFNKFTEYFQSVESPNPYFDKYMEFITQDQFLHPDINADEFGRYIQLQESKKRELYKEMKKHTVTIAALSKWMKVYEKLTDKFKPMKENWDTLQKKQGQDWWAAKAHEKILTEMRDVMADVALVHSYKFTQEMASLSINDTELLESHNELIDITHELMNVWIFEYGAKIAYFGETDKQFKSHWSNLCSLIATRPYIKYDSSFFTSLKPSSSAYSDQVVAYRALSTNLFNMFKHLQYIMGKLNLQQINIEYRVSSQTVDFFEEIMSYYLPKNPEELGPQILSLIKNLWIVVGEAADKTVGTPMALTLGTKAYVTYFGVSLIWIYGGFMILNRAYYGSWSQAKTMTWKVIEDHVPLMNRIYDYDDTGVYLPFKLEYDINDPYYHNKIKPCIPHSVISDETNQNAQNIIDFEKQYFLLQAVNIHRKMCGEEAEKRHWRNEQMYKIIEQFYATMNETSLGQLFWNDNLLNLGYGDFTKAVDITIERELKFIQPKILEFLNQMIKAAPNSDHKQLILQCTKSN